MTEMFDFSGEESNWLVADSLGLSNLFFVLELRQNQQEHTYFKSSKTCIRVCPKNMQTVVYQKWLMLDLSQKG